MGIRSFASKPVAWYFSKRIKRDAQRAVESQNEIFRQLIQKGRKTVFGKIHDFLNIRTIGDFQGKVPVRDYEGFKSWIDDIAAGEKDVLWPGLPIYFAKTSGTTSGSKYIPITKDSLPNHLDSARNALLMYIHETGNSRFTNHRMIFLQGSPVLEKYGIIPSGRLSGIAAHHVPFYLQKNRLPSWKNNCIEDWETKVDAIVEETIRERMAVISGIPSWLRMYFEKLVTKAGKPIGRIFPDLQLLVYGGVNFEPYRPVFEKLIGREVDSIEVFPASEGFIAFQDQLEVEGMLLNTNSGIFYEFIRIDQSGNQNQERLILEQVKTGVDYELIISSNAGLWAYSLGDTVRFTSINPYRVIVSGRTSQFISAFGEHVIVSEIEGALSDALRKNDALVAEFTIAPLLNPEKGKPRHEWLIEFEREPSSLKKFEEDIDMALRKKNSYYDDLISGNVLETLSITLLPQGSFIRYMKERGMLGGQNKVPRLGNNRSVADGLLDVAKKSN